jgi:hypothetical protein
MFRYSSVNLGQIAFQACAIDHSAISHFRINDLRQLEPLGNAICVRPPNGARSLTGISSIAVDASVASLVTPALGTNRFDER